MRRDTSPLTTNRVQLVTILAIAMASPFIIGQGCATPAPAPSCGEFGQFCGGQPVVAVAGADQNVTLGANATSASVTLDGSLSFSTDGLGLTYSWVEDGNQIADGPTPQVQLGEGIHTIRLDLSDTANNTASDAVTIKVAAQGTSLSTDSTICGGIGSSAMVLSLALLALARIGPKSLFAAR